MAFSSARLTALIVSSLMVGFLVLSIMQPCWKSFLDFTGHEWPIQARLPALTSTELLEYDAVSLQQRLQDGTLTSVALVEATLRQIYDFDRRGPHLRAMTSVVAREQLLSTAARLDQERRDGRIRSRFHGIPILIKDAIKTTRNSTGVGTTCGSQALIDADPLTNAALVDNLLENGLVVLGKTNLNELSNYRGSAPSNGWSALGGLTQSAYVPWGFDPADAEMGHTSPCGSSSGSAVGVSAGYAPLAIGTESDGSLVQPANRAALYALKPTVGSVNIDGIWCASKDFMSAGGMAKSVTDLAALTDMILPRQRVSQLLANRFDNHLTRSFAGLRIGYLDPLEWQFPADACPPLEDVFVQTNTSFFAVLNAIQRQDGAHVDERAISLPPLTDLQYQGEAGMITVTFRDYGRNVDHFLSGFRTTHVSSLSELIQFNEDHPRTELPDDHPDQEKLIRALETPTSDNDAALAMAHIRNVSRTNGFDIVFKKRKLNLLAFSMESFIAGMAAAAGYPIATMPLGILEQQRRPFSLGIIASPDREDLMFQFMSAFEATFGPRPLPDRLIQHDRSF